MRTLYILSLLAPVTVIAQTPAVRDNGKDCRCFLVSGKDAGYFQNHRFMDFRNITPANGEDLTRPPALLGKSDTSGNESVTSSFFNSSSWTNDWIVSTGLAMNSSVQSINSARNVFLFRDQQDQITYLALRAQRLESFVSNVEIDTTISNILYSSMRTRARVVPNTVSSSPFINLDAASVQGLNSSHPVAPGAVIGFFTYQSDSQESDIEILTSDPVSNIRYSNQPDYNPSTDTTVPGASTQQLVASTFDWTDWHDHRIDWYNGTSRWYVDNQLVLEKTINVPTMPSQLILNIWSDGGNWSQNMSVGSQVVAAFQWIEMVYNVSGGNGATGQCTTGCNVDGVNKQGTPEKAFGNDGVKIGSAWILQILLLVVAWLWLV